MKEVLDYRPGQLTLFLLNHSTYVKTEIFYCGYVCCEEKPLPVSQNSSAFDVNNYFNWMTRTVISKSKHCPSEDDFVSPNMYHLGKN